MTKRQAVLHSTPSDPIIELRFGWADKVPDGRTVQGWVKALPGRRWQADTKTWLVTDLGPDPETKLAEGGFQVELPPDWQIRSLGQLASPTTEPIMEMGGAECVVRPRLAGFERVEKLIPSGGEWDKTIRGWRVSSLDLDGLEDTLGLTDAARAVVTQAVKQAGSGVPDRSGGTCADLITALANQPDWPETKIAATGNWWMWPQLEGMELLEWQKAALAAILAGRTLLADEMGVGKTFPSMVAQAAAGTKRLLVVCPATALDNWRSEMERTGLWGQDRPFGMAVVLASGRKTPTLPEQGAVIVGYDYLAGAAWDRVTDWQPDGLIVDESHSCKTWGTKRSRAVRSIASRVGTGLRIAITGTPILASALELPAQLAITGHLDATFGGLAKFLQTYAYQNKFGWVPKERASGHLGRVLKQQVRIQRSKADTDRHQGLAGRERVRARIVEVDVDLDAYRQAHQEVAEKLHSWSHRFKQEQGYRPTEHDLRAWAGNAIALSSPLRRAAGLAKVPHAVDYVGRWIKRRHIEGKPEDRPLLIWTHHLEVNNAICQALHDAGCPTQRITGATPTAKRSQIVQAVQAGRVGALVCSIQAANNAITLTRIRDCVFVESDWTPATIRQAIARLDRHGQTGLVRVTMLEAKGTLDERICAVQTTKRRRVAAIEGNPNTISQQLTPTSTLADVIVEIAKRADII